MVLLKPVSATSLRDALATPADTFGYPVTLVNPVALRNSLAALNAVDKRANFLRAGEMLEESALDKYVFNTEAHPLAIEPRMLV